MRLAPRHRGDGGADCTGWNFCDSNSAQNFYTQFVRCFQGFARPPGTNSDRPLFLMSNFGNRASFARSLLRNGTDFAAPAFVDSCFRRHGTPPPPTPAPLLQTPEGALRSNFQGSFDLLRSISVMPSSVMPSPSRPGPPNSDFACPLLPASDRDAYLCHAFWAPSQFPCPVRGALFLESPSLTQPLDPSVAPSAPPPATPSPSTHLPSSSKTCTPPLDPPTHPPQPAVNDWARFFLRFFGQSQILFCAFGASTLRRLGGGGGDGGAGPLPPPTHHPPVLFKGDPQPLLWSATPLVCICLFFNSFSPPPPATH